MITFVEEVILPQHQFNGEGPRKVHIVGNSVGGHLAAHIANLRPDLVDTICLLNPTPGALSVVLCIDTVLMKAHL